MLGSNQRPLPCEFSTPVTAAYRSLREMGLFPEISWHKRDLLLRRLPPFYARVAARLLHSKVCLLTFRKVALTANTRAMRTLPRA
jgi:hypothetical protein